MYAAQEAAMRAHEAVCAKEANLEPECEELPEYEEVDG